MPFVLLFKYLLSNGEFVTVLFPFKSPKVEFFPNSTSKIFPVSILNVLLNLVGLAEYKPTAFSPIFNLEPAPNFTLASPSEYIPIVVAVSLLANSIGALILASPVESFT